MIGSKFLLQQDNDPKVIENCLQFKEVQEVLKLMDWRH